MSVAAEQIDIARCGSCQSRFLPGDGPCPRCGSTLVERYPVPAIGRVIAATALESPPAGWTAPHVLAFVEVSDSVRLLAIVDGDVPTAGTVVSVRRDGAVYRARTEPGGGSAERGEGDSPKAGESGRSFEPPR